ncbi:Uncharacterised protein [Mycobacterium tuberculosis]|uniref:Uncharacterized protein n=2 Tax=Mycobacterium tuberculosis TaxID=1773 RepID=A0A655AI06_MYCTX|nr:Uncharacterised protein [Mycobacterium tuberculosis]CKT34957.1 Uncharacterised protein [Mycobacterium tuberculosis]CNV93638.1 Uncharacterised protein [Mycobacterium tuberculosis]COX58000.1 Uncharacterised protein [Mycobacterium tuberculosis]COZ34000.1 Uncharacterised protein [Mycobacterium tuberculosis]
MVATRIAPTAMRHTMAATLINANQNSSSPKWRTLNKLTARIRATVTRAGTQIGKPGHQNLA